MRGFMTSRGSIDKEPWAEFTRLTKVPRMRAALALLFVAGCANGAQSPSQIPDPPPLVAALDTASAGACLRFPGTLRWVASETPGDFVWARSALVGNQGFELFVDRGPSRFEQTLESRTHLGAHPPAEVLAGDVERHAFELRMGNDLVWATIPSPHRTFTLTLYFKVPLKESIADGDAEGLRAFDAVTDLAKESGKNGHLEPSLACLAAILWPDSR